MGRKCPNCEKGMMILKGNKYNRRWRCCHCGHWIYLSPGGHSKDYMMGSQSTKPRERKKKDDIPVIQEEKPKITEEEKILREEQLRQLRKQESIRRILKEMGKNKYSGFKGKEIFIEGEKYIVE